MVFGIKIPHRQRFRVKVRQTVLLGPAHGFQVLLGGNAAPDLGIFICFEIHMVLMHDVYIGGLGQILGHPLHKFFGSGDPVGHHQVPDHQAPKGDALIIGHHEDDVRALVRHGCGGSTNGDYPR